MVRNISVGIDVGTCTTRIVVGEFNKGEKYPRIIGLGESETRGLRHGYVVDSSATTASIKRAVDAAQNASGVKISRAYISLSGISLRGAYSNGSVIISKADGEVTSLDVNKALQDCEDNLNLNNKKVVQIFPVSYKLDGKEVLGRPEGMRGTKLEAKALFVTYSIQHFDDLVEALADAGIETIDAIVSPIVMSQIALTEKQRIVGVALCNIGYQTTSLSIFENGMLVSIHTFPFGSCDITNDIALVFRIPLQKAEELKLGNISEEYSKKKLNDVIDARLSDIFELIENHLKKIKRSGLLPAGIVFVGGGAGTHGLTDRAKFVLKLPASVGTSELFGNSKTKLRDSTWFSALGVIISGKDSSNADGSFFSLLKDLKSSLKASIKQLMP